MLLVIKIREDVLIEVRRFGLYSYFLLWYYSSLGYIRFIGGYIMTWTDTLVAGGLIYVMFIVGLVFGLWIGKNLK